MTDIQKLEAAVKRAMAFADRVKAITIGTKVTCRFCGYWWHMRTDRAPIRCPDCSRRHPVQARPASSAGVRGESARPAVTRE